MKKYTSLFSLLFILSACDYTQEERYEFYKSCITNHITHVKSIVGKMGVSCACKQWSLRKDIKPKNTDITSRQYYEEEKKCQNTPIKMNFEQKRFCEKGFTRVFSSAAEVYIKAGMPISDITTIGFYDPDIYKRSSNKELIECACMHLSLRDDFIIPDSDKVLKQELDKEVKKCQ